MQLKVYKMQRIIARLPLKLSLLLRLEENSMVVKQQLNKIINNSRIKDLICNILFIITYLIIIIITTHNGKFVLGSKTDFEIQHYILPEYFRTIFYKNFDLFPDFAFNLGAGENIYYFSYYGLLNPIILISYLFPMIKMLDYIIVSMAIVVIGSVSLFYFYLRKNNYSHIISFLSSFILLCSSPLIFHSHRHIMFINYMPFLIMGVYGMDNFVKKGKSLLLISSIVLMIFTSYYFSVSGLVVLFILGIFKYLKLYKNDIRKIFNFLLKLMVRLIIGILIGSVLIFPTLYTLLNGRTDSISSLSLPNLFKPNMYMLYSSYSMGLTLICLIATVYMIFKGKKENKILSIALILVSIFPIFNYALNGFLYINAKTLIPFIPLVLINVSDFFNIVFNKIRIKKILILYVIVSSLLICIISNLFFDKYMSKEEINPQLNNNYNQYITKIIKNDNLYRINSSLIDKTYINRVSNSNEYKTTMYSSTFNKNYKNLYNELFNNPLPYRNKFMISSSNNLLFQMYMGEKYIMTKEKYNYIYEKIDTYNGVNIYKNEYVLPIGYATSEVINDKEFNELNYPSNILNMMGRVVVNDKTNANIIKTDNSQINYNIDSFENIEYKKTDYGYELKAKDKAKINISLDSNTSKKLIFISFDILENSSCNKGDLSIQINDVTNKLTCKEWKYFNENSNFNYTIIPNDNHKLEIQLGKGLYKIGNIKVSLLDFDFIKNINKNIDQFLIDKEKTSGDNIVGKISVKNNSYFTLSIPYDKGFNILVDGKKVEYYIVNKSFIGFKISKGTHEIEIKYKAPYKNFGILVSLFGIILSLLIFINERRFKDGISYNNSTLL